MSRNMQRVLVAVLFLIGFSGSHEWSIAGGYSNAITATPGLQGYWRLGESAGNFADSGPNGFVGIPESTGTLAQNPGVLYAQPGPRPADGFLGFEAGNVAAGFDPGGPTPRTFREWISVADDPAGRLDPRTGDFTTEAWFINDGNNPAEFTWGIVGKLENDGPNAFRTGYFTAYDYWDQADSVVGFYGLEDGPGQTAVTFPAIPVAQDQWHQIVTVLHRNRTSGNTDYTQSGISIFIDGQLIQTIASTYADGGFDINSTSGLAIGGLNSGGSFTYRGNIDEVSVYQRALSPVEILAHYTAALTTPPQLAADYNSDAAVDAADYVVWRKAQNTNVTLPGENPSAVTPGVVDQEDYAFWRTNFGSGGVGSGNGVVPEPGFAPTLIAAIAAWGVSRRKRLARSTCRNN